MLFRTWFVLACAATLMAVIVLKGSAEGLQQADPTEQKAIAELRALGAGVDLHKDDPRQSARSVVCAKVKRIAEAIPHLKKLSKLEVLSFARTNVTGDDLAALAGFDELLEISLRNTKVGDTELARLPKLKKLRFIGLAQTLVTDAGLVHLLNLPNLTGLTLDQTKVGDEGIARVAKLRELTYLHLDSTQITDNSCKHLGTLTKMEHLSLANTEVTDAGVKQLTQLKE